MGFCRTWTDNDEQDIEYLQKIDWLWMQLSEEQRSCVRNAVLKRTLKQQHSKHCIIGNALGTKNTNPTSLKGFRFSKIVNKIFYEGPSYDGLFTRKLFPYDKKILDDIYYGKIGKNEHQYERANHLVYSYISASADRQNMRTAKQTLHLK